MEYNVELVKSTIKKLNASIDVDETATYQIDVENSASVYEPNDETDPTVMVQTESIMKDSSNKCINIHKVTEMIFKFDPIPENRSLEASRYCPPLVSEELNKLAVKILADMGHKFALG